MACRRQISNHCSWLQKHTITTSHCVHIRPVHRAVDITSSSVSLSYVQKRENHHLKNSPNLAQAISTFKRTKHHSAIASEQASRKDELLKLKKRDSSMGKSTNLQFLFMFHVKKFLLVNTPGRIVTTGSGGLIFDKMLPHSTKSPFA